MFKKKTILFIDEIHRFNKLQQDTFLPFVENGTIVLLGATTENPSFSLNSALLSRCRVVILEKLGVQRIQEILQRAADKISFKIIENINSLDEIAKGKQHVGCVLPQQWVFGICHELKEYFLVTIPDHSAKTLITAIRNNMRERRDQHYNCISAFIKSMRGSSVDATLYWLARMVESGEDPRFIARRMVVFASEDIGIADSNALNLAVSTLSCCQNIGMPECRLMIYMFAIMILYTCSCNFD
ncbi:ATPase WRNIP1-like [Centruroides sculpturatus]|uniref:ATPase WRNIP1-like n=1 Tax=Centruroides sculpturatus TaxID=218467 RepID=UPI000C6DFEEE|nr:ATPase WRNIP1-like [Centruroides sculpturatus]